MQQCYHSDASFSDPAFPGLNSREVQAMWQMLLTASKDLKVTFDQVSANDQVGRCHWDAYYTFSRTGRKVHNSINASFHFKEGKILRHDDSFDFWRWSRQALGVSGWWLGWSPMLKTKVQAMARKNLIQFMSKVG
jgi:hypothetical protein